MIEMILSARLAFTVSVSPWKKSAPLMVMVGRDAGWLPLNRYGGVMI